MRLDTQRVARLARAFQIRSESDRQYLDAIRAEFGFSANAALEIRQSLRGHVCAYCRTRLAEKADHTIPLAWIRFAALCKIDVTAESNGAPICYVCDNAKESRQETMAERIAKALKRRAIQYVRRLVREFAETERTLIAKAKRNRAKQKRESGAKARGKQAETARYIRLLFAAFGITRVGPGNTDWGGKASNLTPRQIERGFANLTRSAIDESTQTEFRNIFAATGNVLSVFRAALDTQTVLRRATNQESLTAARRCLAYRAKFFGKLAEYKLGHDWRAKAKASKAAEIEPLWQAYEESRDAILGGTRWFD